MSFDIFISYAPTDLDFVKTLDQDLSKQGYSVYFDEAVERTDFGHKFEVKEKLKQSRLCLFVLSPDGVAFRRIGDHLHSADENGKQILVIQWEAVRLPTDFTIRLQGSRPIGYKQNASSENMAKVFAEVIADIELSLGPAIAPTAFDNSVVSSQSSKHNNISNNKAPDNKALDNKAPLDDSPSPLLLYANIISNLITPLNLDSDYEEEVSQALKWLFVAIDNLLKIERGQLERQAIISVPIPPEAEKLAEANNALLEDPEELLYLNSYEELLEGKVTKIKTILGRGDTYLKGLTELNNRESNQGEAGKSNVPLQKDIKSNQLGLIKLLQETASEINGVYGILINTPTDLQEHLAEYAHPLTFANTIISKVITPLESPFNLEPDYVEDISQAVKWLFNAVHVHQQVYKAIQRQLRQKSKTLKYQGDYLKAMLEDHLPAIHQAEVEASKTLSIPIPATAELLSDNANNRLQTIISAEDIDYLNSALEYYVVFTTDGVKLKANPPQNLRELVTIQANLDSLDTLAASEAKQGEASQRDIALQNNLLNIKIIIFKNLQKVANVMASVYDIQLTDFEEFIEELEAQK